MGCDGGAVKAPSRWMMALEARALLEVSVLLILKPFMKLIPRGDGHPVIVFPGFGAGDWATALLRKFLRCKGYAAYGWKLGVNRGYRKELNKKLENLLTETFNRHQQKVSLVGWSLGGIYARELAKVHPEKVRTVITLGSPFAKVKEGVRIRRIYEFISGHRLDEMDPGMTRNLHKPPPVPTTSIFSASDGVVAEECCIQKETRKSENIQIPGCSHIGFVSNPIVYWVVADRLAQPENSWRPYNGNEMKRAIKAKGLDGECLAV